MKMGRAPAGALAGEYPSGVFATEPYSGFPSLSFFDQMFQINERALAPLGVFKSKNYPHSSPLTALLGPRKFRSFGRFYSLWSNVPSLGLHLVQQRELDGIKTT